MRISSYYHTTNHSDYLSLSTREMLYPKEDSSLLGWAKQLDGLALFIFVFCGMFLYGYGQIRTLGLLVGFTLIMNHGKRFFNDMRFLLYSPPELKLYTIWVLWTGITGMMVAIDMDAFWEGYMVLLQMVVMVWIVYSVLRMTKDTVNGVFLAIVCGGLIQVVTVFREPLNMISEQSERILGETQNPNALGFMMILTILSAFIFWNYPGRIKKLIRIIIICMLPLNVYVLLASGSRKSAITLVFLMCSWLLFISSALKKSTGFLIRLSLFVIFVFTIYAFIPLLLEKTLIGIRFLEFYEFSIQRGVGKLDRYEMYVDGWNIFCEHPYWGVGLNNFGNYFYSGQYSHSDYIEPLVTTGLIGFLLYQSIYVYILYRAIRLIRIVRDKHVLYRLKMIVLGILTIKVHGLGTSFHDTQHVFILITTFSVYTWYILRRVKYEQMQTLIGRSEVANSSKLP